MRNKSEFENFSALTKRLLSVPKTEIDKRHQKWTKQKNQKRKPKKSSVSAASRDSDGDT